MGDEMDRVARAVVESCGDISRTSERVAQTLSLALEAAGSRALSVTEERGHQLAMQRVIFTMDRPPGRSDVALRARAYPLADPVAARLELAVQNRATIGVVVEVLDRCGRSIANATVEYNVFAVI